jgi:hypothetical protein
MQEFPSLPKSTILKKIVSTKLNMLFYEINMKFHLQWTENSCFILMLTYSVDFDDTDSLV